MKIRTGQIWKWRSTSFNQTPFTIAEACGEEHYIVYEDGNRCRHTKVELLADGMCFNKKEDDFSNLYSILKWGE